MVKILDCTIRDGGFQNNWDFSDDCVRDTFLVAHSCGVEFFEIGYRKSCGSRFEKCKAEDLQSLIQAKGSTKLVVMLNSRDFSEELFFQDDFVDAVRVACHPDEIEQGINYCSYLKVLGYETILHLMDVANLSENHLKLLRKYDKESLLYFADSYGTILPQNVKEFFNILKHQGFKKIGFHAHNNKQLAFINTLTAIDCGAYSVDVTAYGMGRAAGNTPAELLLSEIGRPYSAYLKLIEKYYLDLYRKNPWGYSLKNLQGGISNSKVI